ncbi:MAG: hypothetical protein V2A64_06145 [Candidatus Omnitrophota bacterium]
MKKILVAAIVVLISVGFGLSAEAGLTVYNATNQAVAETAAQAIGITPLSAVKAGSVNTINVNANLPCLLSVNISNSRVDWTINSIGDYRIEAAKIDVSTNLNSNVTMNVAGAANLVNANDSKQSLDTYYSFRTASGIPATNEYVTATVFNGDKKILVSNGAGTAYIWNRINAVSGKPAGTYYDNFTVTFSQNL